MRRFLNHRISVDASGKLHPSSVLYPALKKGQQTSDNALNQMLAQATFVSRSATQEGSALEAPAHMGHTVGALFVGLVLAIFALLTVYAARDTVNYCFEKLLSPKYKGVGLFIQFIIFFLLLFLFACLFA